MELTFVDVNLNPKKPRATIHMSSKLGFNNDAMEVMKLSEVKYFRIAYTKDDSQLIKDLYLLPADEIKSAARLAKAGGYYYLNAGDTFKDLKLDYKNNVISFEITVEEYNGSPIYKLTKDRESKREKNDEDETDES